VKGFDDKTHGNGASAREIAETENALGVVFPESYRGFLQEFGWAKFSHQELYGIGSDVPVYLELIRNTIAERNEMEPLLPVSLIPIMNDGAGNHYCLETSKMFSGECPVVLWDHEAGFEQEPTKMSERFDRWLIDLLGRLRPSTK
jgi:hypothetical protein